MATIRQVIDPNLRLKWNNPFWFFSALALAVIALLICYCQSKGGYFEDPYTGQDISAQFVDIRPGFGSIVVAVIMYAALIYRRCIRVTDYPWAWLLVIADLLLVGSFIEIVFTGKDVQLFSIPFFFWNYSITVSPRTLAIFAIFLSWVGARALSGIAVIILAFAMVIRLGDIESQFMTSGVVYVLTSFLSMLIQLKLPAMRPNVSFAEQLMQDMGRTAGRMANEARENVIATGQAAKTVASAAVNAATMAAGAAAGVPVGGVSPLKFSGDNVTAVRPDAVNNPQLRISEVENTGDNI